MKSLLWATTIILFVFSLIHAGDSPAKKVDPETHLRKADEAVKLDPDRSMDLSKSTLMFLKGSDNDYLEIKARLIIGKAYYYKNEFQKALKIMSNVKARISIFQIEDQTKKMKTLFARSYYWLGEVYLKLSRYKKSLKSYLTAIEYCNPEKHSVLRSKIYIAISRAHLLLSEFENTIAYAIKGGKSARESGDIESLFFSSYLHGYVHRELMEYEQGLEEFKKSLKLSEANKMVHLKIMALNEISNIYFLQKKNDRALNLKKEALKLATQTENSTALSYCLHDIAFIFMEKKEFKKALPYFIRSRDLAKKDSNIRGEVITNISIAVLYSKTGNISKSRKIAIQTLAIAETHGLKSEIMDLTKFLSELAVKGNNFRKAYKYLDRSFKLNQEIFSTEKSKKIAELEAEIDMEKSENRILLLEKINEIKQLELDEKNEFITLQKVVTFFLIIIVVLIFLAYRWKMKANIQLRKKGEELEKTLAEIHKLSGLLPICSSCKKIRDDGGYWHQVEEYIKSHSEASFSHSMCPACIDKTYPGRKNGKKNVKKRDKTEKK
ncbi:MAG: hypothetical protein ABFR36_05800 [Acidobacteriota bacterium]